MQCRYDLRVIKITEEIKQRMVKLFRSANTDVINEFRLNFISCYLAKKSIIGRLNS